MLSSLHRSPLTRRLVATSAPYFRLSHSLASTNMSASIKSAHDFLSFVDESPTPFHAVHSAKLRLTAAGFEQIYERDSWSSTVKPGGKYFLTRNSTTLVAFAVGRKWKPGNPVAIVGAHTDSCCLRIKPVSKKQSDGFIQVGVETYGGGLWHTWFDRDLSIAGRAMVKLPDGTISQKLIKVNKPILRIPTLAIHLDRQEKFEFNKETQLFPIAGLVAAELNRTGKDAKSDTLPKEQDDKPVQPLKAITERHHPFIVEIVAKEAGVEAENVLDFELVLYDTQKASLGGLNEELIFSARLDNLGMSYCAVEGLVRSSGNSKFDAQDTTIRLISLFDHEEIGSQSAQGADSNTLPAILRRLSVIPAAAEVVSDDGYEQVTADNSATAYEQTLAKSFLISADMAHSVNPNYSFKYEADHRPEMNKGTVIKINANVRYATNSPGIVLIQEIAKLAKPIEGSSVKQVGVPLQLFVVRNDSSCGSTIGPMLSAALGMRTLDLGNAQLSMHSIRETGGTYDVEYSVRLFESFFEHYGALEGKILD